MNYTGLKELLEVFVEKDCAASEYPSELDELLSDTAKTGVVRFSWELLKPLLKFRLESVLKSEALTRCPEEDEELASQLTQRLDTFDNPPFTIQRVCELVVHPGHHYKRRDRYMRAIEKNLMVVSTQKPDLTWMKSPRLTQLLETEISDGANHNHTQNHTQNHTSTHADSPKFLEQSSITTAGNDRVSPAEEQSVTDMASHSFGLPRKRSASLRDSLDTAERGRGSEEEVMGLVLQEADSTTIEHTSQPLDIGEPPELGELNLRDPSHRQAELGEGPAKGLGAVGLSSTEGCGDREGVRVEGSGVEGGVGNEAETRGGAVSAELVEESAAKKMKLGFEPPREDGELHTGLLERGGEGVVEASQKKETYKEEATGQMESGGAVQESC